MRAPAPVPLPGFAGVELRKATPEPGSCEARDRSQKRQTQGERRQDPREERGSRHWVIVPQKRLRWFFLSRKVDPPQVSQHQWGACTEHMLPEWSLLCSFALRLSLT